MVDEEDQKADKFDFDSAGEAIEYISLDQAAIQGLSVMAPLTTVLCLPTLRISAGIQR